MTPFPAYDSGLKLKPLNKIPKFDLMTILRISLLSSIQKGNSFWLNKICFPVWVELWAAIIQDPDSVYVFICPPWGETRAVHSASVTWSTICAEHFCKSQQACFFGVYLHGVFTNDNDATCSLHPSNTEIVCFLKDIKE